MCRNAALEPRGQVLEASSTLGQSSHVGVDGGDVMTQAEMMMIAVITGADLTYVLTHHLTRLILVVLGAPIVHRLLP